MKTIEVFIKEIEAAANLQKEIKAIKDKDALAEFLKKKDVSGTVEEFVRAMEAGTEGMISDDLAENVAGGFRR